MLPIKKCKENAISAQAILMDSVIHLSPPAQCGEYSIEEVLFKRRSMRSYKRESLQLKEISQLLWAAQGITDTGGRRTAPSAGALYPFKVYLASVKVEGLSPGIFVYDPVNNTLLQKEEGDKRKQLSVAALMQSCVYHCAAVLIFVANHQTVTNKYSKKGKQYVYMEAGHAAQNVCLQAVALHIGTVTLGAFLNGGVKRILHLSNDEEVVYLMPIGKI